LSHFLLSCPPTEFAFAHKAGEDFHHPLTTIARQRAGQLFERVSDCDVLLTFARTFFEQEH
jgi:hypothetical protein